MKTSLIVLFCTLRVLVWMYWTSFTFVVWPSLDFLRVLFKNLKTIIRYLRKLYSHNFIKFYKKFVLDVLRNIIKVLIMSYSFWLKTMNIITVLFVILNLLIISVNVECRWKRFDEYLYPARQMANIITAPLAPCRPGQMRDRSNKCRRFVRS